MSDRPGWKPHFVLALVAAVAGLGGLCSSLRQMAANRYLQEGLGLLALFELRAGLNRWLLASLPAAAMLLVGWKLLLAPLLRRRNLPPAAARPAPRPRWGVAVALASLSATCLAVAVFFLSGAGNGLVPRLVPGARHVRAVHRLATTFGAVSAAAGVVAFLGLLHALRGWLRAPGARARADRIHRAVHSRTALAAGGGALALAIGLNGGLAALRGLRAPVGPNVLLISVDTLRADRLGCYGSSRDTTPNIDALARRGVLFESAYAQAPWTLPSMASVVSSLYPSEHGADAYDRRLPLDVVTLAERLRNRLYVTTGIVTHHFVAGELGFAQGFDAFDERNILGDEGVSSPALTRDAERALAENRSRPFFLWVHYFDPHYSYISHEEFPYSRGYAGSLPRKLKIRQLEDKRASMSEADVQFVRDVYDEEVSFTDRHIGALLGELGRLGLADRTLVVLVGDHGEEFMERGNFGHGTRVYQELAHVPLVIAGPGAGPPGARVKRVVETRSIAKTVSRACGIGDGGFGGSDLLEASGPAQGAGLAYVEGSFAWGRDDRKVGVVSGDWKLIENLDTRLYELYDLKNDPGERTNLHSGTDAATRAASATLVEKLSEFQRRKRREGERTVLEPETEERLRSLGYIR